MDRINILLQLEEVKVPFRENGFIQAYIHLFNCNMNYTLYFILSRRRLQDRG